MIGRGGANVQTIESITGARINIERQQGLEALLNPNAKCEITGSADQIERAKELIQKSVDGEDVAQAAVIAGFVMKLMKELVAEGYSFSSKAS